MKYSNIVRRILSCCRWCIILLIINVNSAYTQNQKPLPENWHLLDYKEDGLYGISLEKAYRKLLVDKNTDTVIVAMIDTGIDTLHVDLRNVLWRNTAEQGADEDHNGYIDDRYGWNFLGGKNGKRLSRVPMEFMRQYFRLKDVYAGKTAEDIKQNQRKEYQLWLRVKRKFKKDSLEWVSYFQDKYRHLRKEDRGIKKILNKEEYTYQEIKGLDKSKIVLDDSEVEDAFIRIYLRRESDENPNTTNKQILTQWKNKMKEAESTSPFSYISYEPKAKRREEIVGDDYYNFKDRHYGNNNIQDVGKHGTHVAGIIGAIRNNGIGGNGIVNTVKLMTIRGVPKEGDEYDKDVALAIRYAVDNGAKVINISFAKDYSPQQKWIEKAIRYAARKDVLLVNGAGNDSRSIDTIPKYPTSRYINKNRRFPNMITVGASGPTKKDLIAPFSNYGTVMVDVFAPGMSIKSTYPGGYYMEKSGTSMAAPVVSGIAALLLSYYPQLSAKEIKEIIEGSVAKINIPVLKPGQVYVDKNEQEWVSMNKLCTTGGIVNAYNALRMAEFFIQKEN